MPAPPNGRVLRFDPSDGGNLLGWWSPQAPESFISTGPTRARDLSGNNRTMIPVTAGTSFGYLGWNPDPALGGVPSFGMDISTASSTGLVAPIPATNPPLSLYVVGYMVSGNTNADLFGLNNNNTSFSNSSKVSIAGTTWVGRIVTGNTMNVNGIAAGIAHVACLAQDVSGSTCSFYIDDPYTPRATATASSTPPAANFAFILNNTISTSIHGGRVTDCLVYSRIHDAGTRIAIMKWLASRNRLPLLRLFGGY